MIRNILKRHGDNISSRMEMPIELKMLTEKREIEKNYQQTGCP